MGEMNRYMTRLISGKVSNILVCSYCGSGLTRAKSGVECLACHANYPVTDSGSLDMRLRRRRKYPLEFELDAPLLPDDGFCFEPLPINSQPEVDFAGVNVPSHLSRGMLSYFPKAKTHDSFVLDLGCGDGIHKDVCEHAGFEWVGLDYDSAKAPILGDGHSLPFKDDTFEFMLSLAVLEHIRFPFVVMREAYRVLKPYGKFIGTVAFLEPFHQNSFYHHTHLGTYNSLQYGGFTIEKIAPVREWPVLTAQAQMALFPKMPRMLSRSIVFPIQLLHQLWWKAAGLLPSERHRVSEERRIRDTSGSFVFVATKE